MTPLKHSGIYGNWVTLLVPVNKDNSINYTLLAEEIDILIAMQVNGIYNKALELEKRIQLFMARYIVPYISRIDPKEVVHLRAACREILPEFCTNI